MIVGIGCDLIEIERIQKACEQITFMNKVFTENEQKWFAKHPGPQHLAGNFAAKEAVSKALGTGLALGIAWTDIEILHDNTGRPLVHLTNVASKKLASMGGRQVLVTISHSQNLAMAYAVIDS